jgi:hypothetical protein
MPSDDTIPTPFDDLLDRLVRNEKIDPDAFLKEHPELSPDERRLLYRLCASPRSPERGERAGESR